MNSVHFLALVLYNTIHLKLECLLHTCYHWAMTVQAQTSAFTSFLILIFFNLYFSVFTIQRHALDFHQPCQYSTTIYLWNLHLSSQKAFTNFCTFLMNYISSQFLQKKNTKRAEKNSHKCISYRHRSIPQKRTWIYTQKTHWHADISQYIKQMK